MHRGLFVILACMVAFSAFGQKPKYEPGTIMAVTAHQSPGQHDSEVTQYDVSLKVGNVMYVVLYTPPNGANRVKYAAGTQWLVLVGSNTLTANTALSGTTEVPILSRETLPAENFDWSKVCGNYFSMKLQRLSERLALTDDQQAQIKPILEQETGKVGQICGTSGLSSAAKLNRYEKIVRASDDKISPLLSAGQLQKLQDLRKEQKLDLKRLIAEQKNGKQS